MMLHELAHRIAALGSGDAILVFSWGSVTGLTLRHLKLTVADALRAHSIERPVNGLVFHARPSTLSEWEAQQNQFRPGLLAYLWSSCFPWHSPLRDENRLLDRPEINDATLSDCAVSFLQQRKQFLANALDILRVGGRLVAAVRTIRQRGSPRTYILGDVPSQCASAKRSRTFSLWHGTGLPQCLRRHGLRYQLHEAQ